MRNYIGLACTIHDPSVAIVDSSGRIVFAEATERPYQTKRAYGVPPDAMTQIGPLLKKYCERGAELVVAKSWSLSAERRFRRVRRLSGFVSFFTPRSRPAAALLDQLFSLGEGLETGIGMASKGTRASVLSPDFALARTLMQSVPRLPTVTGFDHHLTHAAAGCFASPFTEAACAVIDGVGEGTSTKFFRYREGKLEPVPAPANRYSLGLYYMRLCAACGFDPVRGEEWKVMGLAPYGRHDPDLYRLLKSSVEVRGLHMKMSRGGWRTQNALWEEVRHADRANLAFTGQQVFEERVCELLTNLHGLGISDNLVLGGGCALNSSCNGLILDRTPFKQLHVYSAPADDGNSVGAALLAYQKDHPDFRPTPEIGSPYLGSHLSSEALKNLARFDRSGKVKSYPGTIHQVAARALAEGKIIGWAQGRAEFGPRALGNRSILADPRRAEMKDEINARVKFREEFRPFAPAILHEYGPDYFEHYQESPYMERTLRFRDEAAAKVPAVVHVNQTGRLQTVRREWNEKLYNLVQEFHQLTGVPVVLNTSFNVMGKPIIHSVEDAVAVLHTTGLDALALEDLWVEK